jgi:hypothetical protein
MKHKFWCKAVSVVSPGPCDCWFNDPDDNDRGPRRPKPLPPSVGAPPSPVALGPGDRRKENRKAVSKRQEETV